METNSQKLKKIMLIDENECLNGGHNAVYREVLNTIEGTEIYDNPCKFPASSKHPIKGYFVRKQYVKSIPKCEIACLLHLDTIYMYPSLMKRLKEEMGSVIGVLHWFPQGKMKERLLKKTSRYMDVIVVHSEYIKKQLEYVNIINVKTIDYPIFCKMNFHELKKNSSTNKKTFVCMGGSRFDKGLDILADSFQYISEKLREKIKFIVAGEEIDIPYNQILKQARLSDIEVTVHSKCLSEEEYWQCISDADVVLLPYRKIFGGNSGPMTDGIALNKYILGPNYGNLGYLINRYNLGSTFEIENAYSLAKEIERVSQIDTTCNHDYRKCLDVRLFIKKYKELFNTIYNKKIF